MSGQKKRRTAGSVIVSVFLSILLLAPLTVGVLWWELRDILSQEGIAYCLDRIELDEIKLSDVGTGGKGTLLDKLTESVNKAFGSEVVSTADMKEKIEGSTVKSFIAREAGDIFEDFKNGTSKAAVAPEELAAFVEENWHLFEDLLPTFSEKNLEAAADYVIAGDVDGEFKEIVEDHLKRHDPDKKYDGMIRTFRETGKVEEKDRALLIEFLKNELFPGMYKDQISEKLVEEMPRDLNTAYLRRQMKDDEERVLDTAFSMLPGYAVIALSAVLVLLYFVADRHIVGDAFIGIGALLITVCGPLAASGVLDPARNAFRQRLAEENYFAYSLTEAFLGYHRTLNLTAAGIGLGLVLFGIVLNTLSRRRARKADQLVEPVQSGQADPPAQW